MTKNMCGIGPYEPSGRCNFVVLEVGGCSQTPFLQGSPVVFTLFFLLLHSNLTLTQINKSGAVLAGHTTTTFRETAEEAVGTGSILHVVVGAREGSNGVAAQASTSRSTAGLGDDETTVTAK